MPFLIETTVAPEHLEERERIRPAHLDYLREQMGSLLAAGATLSDDGETPTGSFYIVNVEHRPAAEMFIAREPYFLSGICQSVTYKRWRKAIFNYAREVPASERRTR